VGEFVYWDNIAKQANKTESGNTLIGKCVRVAATNDPTVRVRLRTGALITLPPFVFSANKDSYMYLSSPNSNFGTSSLVDVGMIIADPTVARRGVVHFNMDDIPANATVITAILDMYSPTDMGVPPHPAHVYRFTNGIWVETTITWNSDNGSFTTTDPVGVAWNTYDAGGIFGAPPSNIDIATLAQDAYDNRSKQLHILLKVDDESGAVQNGQHLRSKEGTPDEERPKLTVTCTVLT